MAHAATDRCFFASRRQSKGRAAMATSENAAPFITVSVAARRPIRPDQLVACRAASFALSGFIEVSFLGVPRSVFLTVARRQEGAQGVGASALRLICQRKSQYGPSQLVSLLHFLLPPRIGEQLIQYEGGAGGQGGPGGDGCGVQAGSSRKGCERVSEAGPSSRPARSRGPRRRWCRQGRAGVWEAPVGGCVGGCSRPCAHPSEGVPEGASGGVQRGVLEVVRRPASEGENDEENGLRRPRFQGFRGAFSGPRRSASAASG